MQVPVGLPLLVRRLHHRLVAAGPRVVDQYVRAAEGLFDRADQSLGALARRHVAADAFGSNAELPRDPPSFGADPLGAARRQRHLDALRRKALRDRQADSDAAAGDDGDLPRKPEVHDPPFLSR